MPLTWGQEHVWLDSQLAPDESAYNEAVMIRRTGRCDVDALRRAFNLALSRHDAWRTNFVAEDGRLHQVIRPHSDHPLPLMDLSSLPEHEREARAVTVAAEYARAPFDLEHDLLVRPLLVRLSEVDHRLYLTLHHLIFDGVALRLLLSEMIQAYDSLAAGHPVELADPPAPYAHYACWERRHVTPDWLEPRLAFWRDRLRGATPVALPVDRPPPSTRTRHGAMARTFVDRSTIDRLKEVAQQEGATFFLVLLTAYAVLLHRYSGQEDLVIAALVDGRRHRSLEKVMGFMVNPLPVRVDVTGDPSFTELLGRVRESFLIGLANEVPLGELLRALHPGREPSLNPIFQAMFSLDPPLPPLGDGWELDEIDVEFTAAKCDVSCNSSDREEGVVGRFVYSTDLFDADAWKRLAERWGVLLEGIATDPSCRVSALPFMTDAERMTLLDEWNRTEAPYPATSCVHELFEEQARIQPEALAVVHGNRKLTYGQLDAAADELAGRLRRLGVGPDALVGLCAERSPEMVVAVLGILKAGGAYLPLDPAHPAERLAFIVEDADIRAVVTQTQLLSRLPETDVSIICVDQPDPAVGATAGARARPDDLAYVIYTSGSTGSPKGVMIEHRGVVNHVAALIRDYGLGPADTVIQLPPLSVHPSVRDILGTLSAGARLVLLDEVQAKDPLQIVEIIAREGVTCALSFVPSLLRAILDDPRTNELPDARLRLILTCGEQLREQDAQRARKRFGCVVANQFGPTETIMACSKYTDDDGGPPGAMVPAGRAEANARLYVVSSHDALAPIGAAGELLVGGVSLARGYLNRPELTAERFGADPFCAAPGARVHRTGDLVRYRTDGCLEFLGRVDDQVKIRGYRVELGEVEAELALCPGVNRAAVALQTDDQGNRRLLGVVTSDRGGPSLDTRAVRSWLERRLPAYMVPAAIVIVEQLPLKPSGKVDRASLSALDPRPDADLEYVPPATATERVLADIWAEVLNVERVGVDDNFFALGGDSLLGAVLFAKMAQRMDASVPLGLLFRAPTIRELASALDTDVGREETSVVPVRAAGSGPLSFAQQRMWLLDQLEPTSWTYNQRLVRRLHGPVDVLALQRALDEILVRHETLRTIFVTRDGGPVQRVGPPEPCELTVVDVSDRPRPEAEAKARRLAGEEARRRFDLTTGPVFRALLVRLSNEDHVLALMAHHIATDAWSKAVLLEELGALYNTFARGEPSPLDPLPIQYSDFAVWQRNRMTGDARRAQLDYWRQRLAGLPPMLELPTDRPRPARRTGRGGVVDVQIAAPLAAELRRVTREGRVTLFMTILTAFQLLLARYSGQLDIAVGTAIANRARPETEGLIGFFANTLVLRTDLSGDPSFLEVLARVREVALGAYENQDLPFEQLVEALGPERTLSYTPLFQHMFVFDNTPGRDLALEGVTSADFPVDHDTAMFDLTLTLSEANDGLVGTLEYASDLYDRTTAERMVGHFQNLLMAIVADPHRPIGELELLSDAEREQVVVGWNETRMPFPADRCIHELFEDQVAAHPDAVALTAGDVSLTYQDLNERANRLAGLLQSLGVGPDVRVGICLHRSADAIVALLATLKAAGAYLAMDPDYPPARLAFMVEDAAVDLVVTEGILLDRFGPCRARTVCVDLDAKRIAAAPTVNPARGASPNSLAYVVYTSGSTGTPKGVMVEHRAVVALLFGVDYIRFDQVDALLHMAPLAFDASTFEIWGALLHGRRCVVYTDRNFSLERFVAVMRTAKVDTLWLTAALFNVVIDEDHRHLAGVRQLIIGGEALSPPHVARALRLLPTLRLVNGYGPTEATTFAACYEIRALESEAGSVPIGRPIANTELYILDANGRPVPIGVAGELYIGGAGLARGYLDRPELTAERFLSHPFSPHPQARVYRTGDLARYRADGNIEFLGRIDDQVKIRGFRVEPGEVEAVLRQHPAVADAAVMAPEDDRGQRRLVAYVVTAPTTPISTSNLRDHLRARLPDYLVPAAFVTVDALPLSPNGKLDRAALAALEAQPDAEISYAAPATATERVLADIWAEVLGLERVGLDDNFFSSGGDSLLGAVLFAKTTRRTGKAIPLSLLFRGPSIREVARALDEDDAEEQTSVVPLRAGGSKPPLFLAHGVSGLLFRYMHLVRRLDPEQSVYGLQPTMEFVDSRRRLRIEDLAGRYVEDIVRMQPDGPYRLAGFCFGGIVVLEVAHQLEQLGHTVATLALFDAAPPSSTRASRARREAAQLASLVRRHESATAYVQRRLANARVKARRWPWLADYWLHVRTGRPLPNRWDDVERMESLQASPLWRSLSRALGSYVAPTTNCRVTFFRAGEPTADRTEVRFLPGDDRAGECYVIDGPGLSHGTLMEEPHVGSLATALTELLDRVESPTAI